MYARYVSNIQYAQFKSQVRGRLSKQQQDIGKDMSISINVFLIG